MRLYKNTINKFFSSIIAIAVFLCTFTNVNASEAGNIPTIPNQAETGIIVAPNFNNGDLLNNQIFQNSTKVPDTNTVNEQAVSPSSDYDDEIFFTEPEQVLEEDKEAEAEDNVRVYPKWQGRRKKPTKDNDYYIKVNKKTCTVTIYIKEENGDLTPYKAMVCSIGREGHDTPEGKGFKTSDYYDWRLMVDNTYGRYAVRFNKSIMFHSVPYYKTKKDSLEWQDYNKLGKPASLGCIRLAVADAKWIFDNCKRGTEVEVYSGDASTDPLGTPEPIKLDTKSVYRDWDPTDLTKENPWLVPVE